ISADHRAANKSCAHGSRQFRCDEQTVFVCWRQIDLISVGRIRRRVYRELQKELDPIRGLAAKVKKRVSAPLLCRVLRQIFVGDLAKEAKDFDEVRLARPIAADEDVQIIEPQLLVANRLEALDPEFLELSSHSGTTLGQMIGLGKMRFAADHARSRMSENMIL